MTATAKVLVAVRVRPLTSKDYTRHPEVITCAKPIDNKSVVLWESDDDKNPLKRKLKEKTFNFDYVFEESASQIDIYQCTTKFLIDSVISGFNATVFAYGATGAGKTYTMMGTDKEPGIIFLTMSDLFRSLETAQEDGVFVIYNENIRDLLSGKSDHLDLREDSGKGVVVAGITAVEANSAIEVIEYLQKGNRYRSQEATGANESSSRSHAVLQITITNKVIDGKTTKQRIGKLSMIDLAGSERAAETNNRGQRMIEAANINRSLLALGNCINALENGRTKYVNYRDSKLTRLLKDSLGGNCRTVMIANISPASFSLDETTNTLKYATRARAIKTTVTSNIKHKNVAYTTLIEDLRGQIEALRGRLAKREIETPSGFDVQKKREDEENKSFLELRNAIVGFFQEQMKVREIILELEEESIETKVLLAQKEMELQAMEQDIVAGVDEEMDAYAIVVQEIQSLQQREKKLEKKKEKYKARLKDYDERLAREEEKAKNIPNVRLREYMELLLKTCLIEVENSVMETDLLVTEGSLRCKDMEIEGLTAKVERIHRVASLQQQLLVENDIQVSPEISNFFAAAERETRMKEEAAEMNAAEEIESEFSDKEIDDGKPMRKETSILSLFVSPSADQLSSELEKEKQLKKARTRLALINKSKEVSTPPDQNKSEKQQQQQQTERVEKDTLESIPSLDAGNESRNSNHNLIKSTKQKQKEDRSKLLQKANGIKEKARKRFFSILSKEE